MNRRQLTASLAALGTTPFFAAGRASAQSVRPIVAGLTGQSAAEWPTYVADELGYFTRFNLNPTYVVVGASAAAAQQLVAGALDVSKGSTTQTVLAVQGGAKLRLFCEDMVGPPFSFVAQKPYKTYADLKGKTVIIGGPSDITVIFTEKMLARAGLKMSDVDFTYAGGTGDRYAALKSGAVAAAILFPPFDFRAIDEGYSLLGTLAQAMPPFPFNGWAATDAYAQGHSSMLVDFTKAHLLGVRWLVNPQNRQSAIDMLVKRINVTAVDAAKSYDIIVTKSRAFSTTGTTSTQNGATVIDALAQLKLLNAPLPSPTSFFDNRYALQANTELARRR